MRGTPAILVSLTAHVVAIFVVAWLAPATDEVVEAAEPPAVALVAEPIAVEIVEVPAQGGGVPAGGAQRRGDGTAAVVQRLGGVRTAGIAQLAHVPGERAGGGGEFGAPRGHSLMTMRGPDLRLGEGFATHLAEQGERHEPVARSGKLDPSGHGTHTIHDRVTTVTIDRDGSAHFHDKPDFDFHLDLTLPTPDDIIRGFREAGRDIARWYEDPYKLSRAGRMQDVPRHLNAVPGACDGFYDPCSMEVRQIENGGDGAAEHGGVAHGNASLTDYLMRKTVGDPYASRKLKLLDDTRDERVEIGARHAKEDLDRSVQLMRRNLDALWRTTRDPVRRREELFALWDECAEGDGPTGEAGERARRAVLGWIRAKLPKDSPDAYSPNEVARLSARRTSTQPFVPYE